MDEITEKFKKEKVTQDIEFCVFCGMKTEYRKNDPIETRIGYMHGAGQLCQECHKKLYPEGEESYD